MKILYVITKANWGGAQRYVYDLAIAAKEQGYEVLVAYGMPGRLADMLAGVGIETVQIGGLSRDIGLSNELRAWRELLRILRAKRPDVVHVNSSKGGLALLAARLANVPRIFFTAHGWAFNEARPWWQKLVLRAVYLVTMLLAHETICVSDAIARDVRFVPFAKRVVVKNGIDAPTLRPRPIARDLLKPGMHSVTWIGMIAELHPTKRIRDAIEAIAPIPETILVVLGEGEERGALEKLIRTKGLESRVFLPGFISEAPSYLAAFDIFLMISKTEALAYAAIEAGYASLPVIATNVGGLPEIIKDGETGLLVPPLSPSAITKAIQELRENRESAKQLGQALRAHVEKEFSKERMIRETFAVYRRT